MKIPDRPGRSDDKVVELWSGAHVLPIVLRSMISVGSVHAGAPRGMGTYSLVSSAVVPSVYSHD
jgi:hypothetical protein